MGACHSASPCRHDRHHSPGERQPQLKNEYQGTSRTRPRTASTETKTLGLQSSSTFSSMTGSWPSISRTSVRITPLRSTATSTVAWRKGLRTWKRAVSPGW